MSSLSQPVIISAMVIAAIIAIYALPTAISPFAVKIKRADTNLTARAVAIGVVLTACGVLVAGATGLPSTAAAHHPGSTPVVITTPGTPAAGGAPPEVPCSMTVRGTGRPPSGDRFAIATQRSGSSEIYYESSVEEITDPEGWSASITFGGPADTGAGYRLIVFAIPASWETYIVTAVDGISGQNTWWQSSGPPPEPARQLAELSVIRSAEKTQC